MTLRPQKRRYVLDANALVSLIEGRAIAAERVRRLLQEAVRIDQPVLLSSINWGEVFYIAWRLHGEARAIATEFKLKQLPIQVIPVDRSRATRAATLKQRHNLGYADSFAAELAIDQDAWLVTADPDFGKLGRTLSVYPLPRHEK